MRANGLQESGLWVRKEAQARPIGFRAGTLRWGRKHKRLGSGPGAGRLGEVGGKPLEALFWPPAQEPYEKVAHSTSCLYY